MEAEGEAQHLGLDVADLGVHVVTLGAAVLLIAVGEDGVGVRVPGGGIVPSPPAVVAVESQRLKADEEIESWKREVEQIDRYVKGSTGMKASGSLRD